MNKSLSCSEIINARSQFSRLRILSDSTKRFYELRN